jgi:hypothetical protein
MGEWRKSSYSNANGWTCVEATSGTDVVQVRDAADRDGGTLTLTAGAWQLFVARLRP